MEASVAGTGVLRRRRSSTTTRDVLLQQHPHHPHCGKTVTFQFDQINSSDNDNPRDDEEQPLCGRTVEFAVDHADDDGVLYIPREDNNLLPIVKLVIRTILEDKTVKLNRFTLYDTVQKYAQTKVEIQQLQHQVNQMQCQYSRLMTEFRNYKTMVIEQQQQQHQNHQYCSSGGIHRLNCGSSYQRKHRAAVQAEATLLERCKRFWGTKKPKPPHALEISAQDVVEQRRRTLQGSIDAATSTEASSSPSLSPPSRIELLRNRRKYLESMTQDLLKLEIDSCAAATKQVVTVVPTTTDKNGNNIQQPVGGVGSKDDSMSTCSSTLSDAAAAEEDEPLLEESLVRIISTRIEV